MSTIPLPRVLPFLTSSLLLWAVLTTVGHAADVNSTWTGSSGNWSVAGSWNPNANYPNNGNGGLTYNARGPTVANITVTLTEPITLQQYTNAGGTLTGDFPLTLNERFTWTGGTISGNAAINANGGAVLATGTKTLTGRTLNIGAATTANWAAGTIASGGGAVLNIGSGALFDAAFNGSLTVTPAGSATLTNFGRFRKSAGPITDDTSVAALFNNQTGATVEVASGILNLTGGGNSTGAFTVSSGATLSFGGGAHVLDGSSSVSGAGTNRVSAGSLVLAGTYDMGSGSTVISAGTASFTGPNPKPGNLLLSGTASASASFASGGSVPVPVAGASITGGTLGGSDSLDVSGNFVWGGGTMSGSGVVQALGGMSLNGLTKTLNGRKLSLATGTTNTWSLGTIALGQGAVFNIDPLAVFNNNFDGQITLSSGSAEITNHGTFRKSGGVAVTAIAPPFYNVAPAIVDADSGTLSFDGGGTASGAFQIGPGATLRFGGGNYLLDAASSVIGAGTNSVSAGTISYNGSYDVSGGTAVTGGSARFNSPVTNVGALSVSGASPAVSLSFNTGSSIPATRLAVSGGTLGGGDAINVAGLFTWSGGTLAGTGALNADAGGVFNGGIKTLNPRILNLKSGTTNTWSVGTINSGGGAVLNNSGAFNITFDGSYNATAGGSSTINNTGSFRKSAGTVTATIGPEFNNASSGSVYVESGALNFIGGGTSSGSFDVSDGATLGFGGGSHTLDASSTVTGAGTNTVTSGAVTYNGSYNVAGGTRVGGGSATFSGPVTGIGALALTGGNATFSSGGAIAASSFTMSSGTLGGTDSLNVAGNLVWTGGTIAGTGAVNANGPLTLSGAIRTLNGRLNVNNAASWSAGSVNSGQSAVLTIGTGVLFDNVFDGAYQFIGGGSSVITNRGTFRKSGGVGVGGTVISAAFHNAPGGGVDVASGTLSLNGGGNSSGSFTTVANSTLQFGGGSHFLDANSTVGGPGTNRISGGTVNFGGAVSVTGGITVIGGTANFSGSVGGGVPLTVSGGIVNFNGSAGLTFTSVAMSAGIVGGTNDLTISGPFVWNGGTLGGSGQVTANGGATFGNANRSFAGRKLTIPSGKSAAWTAGNFTADQGANLDIAGTLDIGFDGQYSSGFNGSAVVNNTGTIRKSGGTGTATIGVAFNNNGTLDVSSGRVDLTGGGTGTGRFTAAATTTLGFINGFGSGIHNLGAGSSITGAGTISFEGPTVNFGGTYDVSGTTAFNGGTVNFTTGATIQSLGTSPTIASSTVNLDTGTPMTFPTLTLSGGNLGGGDAVSVTGSFVWSGGSLSGTNTFNANGGVTMNGFSKSIFSRRFNLSGSSTWSAGNIDTEIGAVFYIQPGATLDNSFDGSIGGIIGNGGITNAGTFRKSGGSGSTTFTSRLNNQGTVEINTGTLEFTFGVYSQTAGTTFLNGGSLVLGREFDLVGGNLTGAGTVTGPVTNVAGAISPGSPVGVLNIAGDYGQSAAGVLNFDLGGTIAGTGYDQINFSSGSTTLGGTLSVTLTNGFLPSVGDGFRVMTFTDRAGDFSNFVGFDLGVTDRHLEAVYDSTGLTLVTRPGPLVTAGPTITLQLLPPSTLELTWPSQDSDFHVESTTNLTTPDWQAFGSPGTNQVFIPINAAELQRYFRLKKP